MGKNLLNKQKQGLRYRWRRTIRFFNQTGKKLVRRIHIIYKRTAKRSLASFSTWKRATTYYFGIFVVKENSVATKMADFVDRFDVAHERVATKTEKAVGQGNRRFRFARIMIDRKRSQLLKHFTIIVMVAIGVLSLFNYATGYEYSYNGKVLGVVDDQEDVYSVLDIASKQLSEAHDVNISIEQSSDIEFRKVVTINRDVDDMEEILNRLTYMKDINVSGYGIFVDGKRAAVLPSKAEAKKVLAGLMDKYSKTKKGTRYESISFTEDVTIGEVATKLGNLQRSATVSELLLSGEISEKVHRVTSGETKKSVAKAYGISVAALEKANPSVADRKLKVGDKLTITAKESLIHVTTVEKTTYSVKVKYKTVRKNNPNAYKGINTVKTKGVNGKNQIVARITRVNGSETKRTILKTTKVKKSVTKVILVGTKKIPPTMGDGTFINPCPAGRLSSPFGYRWGRMHWGIDLACATGSTIRAADGGTVVFAGWNGAQGYTVRINHKNGFETHYCHCSKILVHVGQKVYEGQTIARVGSTGYTTGPHLHFEVEKNGVLVNPLNYI